MCDFDYSTYKTRLQQFNTTEKYRNEMTFLSGIMQIDEDDSILDYGCGTGTFMNYISDSYSKKIDGFDVYNYTEDLDTVYIDHLEKKYNKVCFFHSLAHIPDPEACIDKLKKHLKPSAFIFVITPNKAFDDILRKRNTSSDYRPDPTVISHFDQSRLIRLFRDLGFDVILHGQFGKTVSTVNERLFMIARLRNI